MKSNFSDFFDVDRNIMKREGILDISLIADTMAFIDPFLLFNSKKKSYQDTHKSMVKYIKFLCQNAERAEKDEYFRRKYYYFKEPKQNWLGYTEYGNSGRGLAKDFALKFCANAKKFARNFGDEKVTESSHPEKLYIFNYDDGVDSISDFTTRLILPFLLEFTQRFCKKYVKSIYWGEHTISKVEFDYEHEEWLGKKYILPTQSNNDYVILVPNDILIYGGLFISRQDFMKSIAFRRFEIANPTIRERVNDYLTEEVKKEYVKEKERLFETLIEENPELIDDYIRYKEVNKIDANRNNQKFRDEYEKVFEQNYTALIDALKKNSAFFEFDNVNDKNDVRIRMAELKKIIENKSGNYFLYMDENLISNKRFSRLMNRIWFADIPRNNNDSLKTDIEFKLVHNSPIEQVLEARFLKPTTKEKFLVYLCENKHDKERLEKVINKLGLGNNPNLTVIFIGD